MSHIALFIATVAGLSAAVVPVTIGLVHQSKDHRRRSAAGAVAE